MKLSRKEAFDKKIVDFDITRSCGFYSFVANNKYAGRSLSSTFYYELGMYGNFDPSELSTYTAYTLFREMPDSKDMLPSVDKRKNCFFRNRIGLDGVRNIGRRFENIATAYSSSEVEKIIIKYNNREKILNDDGEQQYAVCSLCTPKLFDGIDCNELSTNAIDKEEKSLDGIAMSCTLASIESLKPILIRRHIDFATVGEKLEKIFNIAYGNILRENLYRNNGKDMEKTIDCAEVGILKIKRCINLAAVKFEKMAPEVFDTILKVCEDVYGKYNIDHRLPYNEKAIMVSMANITVTDYMENLARIIDNSRPENIDKTIDKIINSGIAILEDNTDVKYIPNVSLNNRHGCMAM